MKTKKIIFFATLVFFLQSFSLPAFAENAGAYPNGQAYQNSINSGVSNPGSGLPTQSVASTGNNTSSSSGWNISSLKNFGLPGGTLTQIITNILTWILGIFGFIGIIGFAISGIMYLTAAGNDDQEKKAKKAMTASIYGVIVGLAGLVVIMAVHAALSGTASF